MSTRLNHGAKSSAQNAIDNLLNSAVRFIDCPLEDEEMRDLWHALCDQEYVRAAQTVMDHKPGDEYHMLDDDVIFYVGDYTLSADEADLHSPVLYEVRLEVPERGFVKPSDKQAHASPRWHDAVKNGRRPTFLPERVSVTLADVRAKLSPDKADAFIEWMKACVILDADLTVSKKVLSDLFEMIKTSGQLKRMVPDLFKYIPQEQREAFDDQKRASSYPFEWPAYPRRDVDTLLQTLLKCHLLQGSDKERRRNATVDWKRTWVVAHNLPLGTHNVPTE